MRPEMADDLVERLQMREHHFRRAVEGEYDANLLMKARFALEDAAARIEALEAALAEARRQALEEAAKVAEGFLVEEPVEFADHVAQGMVEDIAQAIRALALQDRQGKEGV